MDKLKYCFDTKGSLKDEQNRKDYDQFVDNISNGNKWFNYCKDQGLSSAFSPTIGTIMNQIDKNIKFTEPDNTKQDEQSESDTEGTKKKRKSTKVSEPTVTVSELTDLFIDQTKFFEEAMVREQVFHLRSKEMVVQAEFDKLDARKKEITDKEISKRNFLYFGMSSFFTAQFITGYHCIFNVEWLGWDLVEPVTYTVGQGSFMLGLLYILRNRGISVEYTGLEDHFKRRMEKKWQNKYDFNLKRYYFLKNKLARIQEELRACEKQRFA